MIKCLKWKLSSLISITSFFMGIDSQAKPQLDHVPIGKRFTKEELMAELTGRDYSKINEIDLYAEIISSYQIQDRNRMKAQVEIFTGRFPKSIYADNALFLMGRVELENKNYPAALKCFQKIQLEYPYSNKMVSTQYLKGVAYKKMNLNNEARRVFREVMAKFPGSPESFRADNELKLMNTGI